MMGQIKIIFMIQSPAEKYFWLNKNLLELKEGVYNWHKQDSNGCAHSTNPTKMIAMHIFLFCTMLMAATHLRSVQIFDWKWFPHSIHIEDC